VLADRGYYEGCEILQCERLLAHDHPKPMTSNNLADGLFDKRDFVYDAQKDAYRCRPDARHLPFHRRGCKTLHKYGRRTAPVR